MKCSRRRKNTMHFFSLHLLRENDTVKSLKMAVAVTKYRYITFQVELSNLNSTRFGSVVKEIDSIRFFDILDLVRFDSLNMFFSFELSNIRFGFDLCFGLRFFPSALFFNETIIFASLFKILVSISLLHTQKFLL